MNRRQVLLASLRSGPATRSTLSKATGISQPTTGKIIEELIGDGVLRETVVTTKSRRAGHPGYFVKVDDVEPRFLGVHLGVGRTRLASLAVAPMLHDVWNKTLPTSKTAAEWVAAVAEAARPLLRQQTAGVLVSLPGVLDAATGVMLLSPHARGFEGHAVADAIGTALGLPAHAVPDVHCLAVGHRAVTPACENFMLVDFGVGVGAAAVVRGVLARGPLPFAGELGHTPVPGHTALCACGGIGCLETIVGRRRLFKTADADVDADALTPAENEALADPAVAARVHAAMEAAGFAIAAAMSVQGFDHAVITGFVADLPPELFAVLRRSITTASVASRFGLVRVDAVPRHRLAGLANVGIDQILVPA